MRSYPSLVTAQKVASTTANVSAAYYTLGRPSDGGGSWASLTGRLKKFSFYWEPYALEAVIVLSNHDGAWNSTDLKGKWVRVGLGVESYSSLDIDPPHPPYLKVWEQQVTSEGGKSEYVLYCLGGWSLLSKWIADTDITFNDVTINPTYSNMTIRQIIQTFITPGVTDLALGADLDSPPAGEKIDIWKPVVQLLEGTSARSFLRDILYESKGYLLPRTDKMHLRFPQDAEGNTYSYTMDGLQHWWKLGNKLDALYSPMKIRVHGLEYTGIAQDAAWQSWMGEAIVWDRAGLITAQADADFLAQAYLDKAKGTASYGEAYCKIPNCLQEIYDKVTFTDARAAGAASMSGRVGGLYYEYDPRQSDGKMSKFSMIVRLGGIQREMGTTLPELNEDFELVDRPDTVYYNPNSGPPVPTFGYDHNLIFSAIDYNTVKWEKSGGGEATIKFSNGIVLKINAGQADISQLTYFFYHFGDPVLKTTTNYAVMAGNPNNIFLACAIPNSDTAKKAIISLYYSQMPLQLDDGVAPAAPTGLAAQGYAGGVLLTWNGNTEPDFARYKLFRNTVNNSGTATLRTTTTALSFTDYGAPGQVYYYWLKAVDVRGLESGFSAVASATAGLFPGVDIEDDSLYADLFKVGLQPYSSDITFSPKSGAEHDQLQWSAGTIQFADGRTQSITAGTTTAQLPEGLSYVYFTLGSTVLTVTQIYSECFGNTKGLLCEVYHSSQDITSELGIAPYRSKGTNLIVDFLAVKKLSAIAADLGVVNAGTLTGCTVRTGASGARIIMEGAGTTKYLRGYNASEVINFELNTDGSFWIGKGSGDKRLNWDTNNLYIRGRVIVDSVDSEITTGSTLTVNGSLVVSNVLSVTTGGISIFGERLFFYDSVPTIRGRIYGGYYNGMNGLVVYGNGGLTLGCSQLGGLALDQDAVTENMRPDISNYRSLGTSNYKYDTLWLGYVLQLPVRSSPPLSVVEGAMYYYRSGSTRQIKVFDGTSWGTIGISF